MGKTLFDKIWDAHVVDTMENGRAILYIDKQYIHEVTSPQAFEGIRRRGCGIFRKDQITASPDHNIPTLNQLEPIRDEMSARQVATLIKNCKEFDIQLFPIGHENNGIIHVIGPQLGMTQPGMTIVCGDSHTSTHGAMGSIAFGIGTSEVEMVFASQSILQQKPKRMRINVDGKLRPQVCAKDVILYIISRLGTGGGTGYFLEFAGSTIRSLSMEGRMTICNMSIEMGARGGMIAPDQTTFDYLKGRPYAPQGKAWEEAVGRWSRLCSDEDAVFDKEVFFQAEDILPQISYGTNPGMCIPVSGNIPRKKEGDREFNEQLEKALKYMGFEEGEAMAGKPVDYVFVGSCTNGRIEDLRLFCQYLKGHTISDQVTVWVVPGSKGVEKMAREEGLDRILQAAGCQLREPGCSACLAMNEDKIPAGKYCVSTSNRNFEGRQGPGARTLLAGPAVAALAAIHGKITPVEETSC